MAGRIVSHLNQILVAAALVVPALASQPALAQAKKKPVPFMVQRTSPQKATSIWKPVIAQANRPKQRCMICSPPVTGPSPSTAQFVQNAQRSVQGMPKKPIIMTASDEEWRRFWGVLNSGNRPVQPTKPYLRWGHYKSAYTRETLDKLNRVSMANVMQPRAQKGKRLKSGNVAKGMCFQAVKETLQDSGIIKKYPWIEAARDAVPYLNSQKYPNGKPMFANITADLKADASKTPPGAIIVYGGGKWGHIELKIKNQYCSDHCNAVPIDQKLSRHVIGIFLPIAMEN